MNKPFNKVALALWIVAAITVFLNSLEIWNAARGMAALGGGSGHVFWVGLSSTFSNWRS
jgi:hypothetical protein